jgi:hypothetical protein
MAIYQPENWLTGDDIELIQLLATILTSPEPISSNVTDGRVPLSPSEAKQLFSLLEKLVSSREFRETTYFIEGLTQGHVTERDDLREIYLSRRKMRGRSRALSSTHWRAFLNRIGVTKFSYGSASRADIYTTRMTYKYFLEMERRLIVKRNIPLRLRAVIMDVVTKYQEDVEAARNGEKRMSDGSILKGVESMLGILNSPNESEVEPMEPSRLAGLATLIADTSVLYTTRDWSTAGTMSAMAGALCVTAYQ